MAASLCEEFSKHDPIKALEIPVQGGWHSPFMNKAADRFTSFIKDFNFKKTDNMIIDNNSDFIETDYDYQTALVEHIRSPVLWYQSIKKLFDRDLNVFVEIGFGNQLSKFVKITNRRVQVLQTGNLPSVTKTIQILQNET